MKGRLAAAKVWGVLNGPDGTRIPIRDRRVASMLEQGQRERAELADYRVAWQELVTRHNRLERCGWSRLGRRLRLAPRAGAASQHERRVVAAEVREAMERPEGTHGSEPSSNGADPKPAN